MTVERFNSLVDKITIQFTKFCTKNKADNWEKQREYFNTLLVRNHLLKVDQESDFWRAVDSACDFVDDPNPKRKKDMDYVWECDVAFCVLYMHHCMKKWSKRKENKEDEEY